MNNTSSLELPIELKERIEHVAKERNEEPVQAAGPRYRGLNPTTRIG